MRKHRWVFAFLLLIGFNTTLMADDFSELENIHQLDDKTEHQNIILSIPDEYYLADKPKYIALNPDTKQVNITAQEIHYSEEAESFARHRRHYIAFWSLFLIMFGVDILWAE